LALALALSGLALLTSLDATPLQEPTGHDRQQDRYKEHVGSSQTDSKPDVASVDGVTAETLNDHYAAISTDKSYTAPTRKQSTTTTQTAFVSDWQVFRALDSLRPTAMGLDGLPAWFL